MDKISYREGIEMQKFYDKRFGGRAVNEDKKQVIVMLSGMQGGRDR